MQTMLYSVVFWSAWIIIPVIVEIIPSLGGVILLVRRRIQRLALSPKPRGLAEERADFGQAFRKELVEVGKSIGRLRSWANAEAVDQKEAL
jgi:hypothetical protein